MSPLTSYSDLTMSLGASRWRARGRASVAIKSDRVEIRADEPQWSYCASLAIRNVFPNDHWSSGPVRIILPVHVTHGVAGFAVATASGKFAVAEQCVPTDSSVTLVFDIAFGADAVELIVRPAIAGALALSIGEVIVLSHLDVDVTPYATEFAALTLKRPADAAAFLAQRIFGEIPGRSPIYRPFCKQPIPLNPDNLWQSPVEQQIYRSAKDIVGALPYFSPKAMGVHQDFSYLNNEFFERYLVSNVSRVLNVVRELQALGLTSGSILEVGSYFGSFALPLQRLGYEVTAIDRYKSFGGALDRHVGLMRDSAVVVIEADRQTEPEILEGLGTFDGVISMAVIEHIPHTPRLFLESLRRRCRDRAVLCLDTPNLTSFHKRQKFADGNSPMPDLEHQYFCDPPYEGHHREYTGPELTWMLKNLRCSDISLSYFDYNCLQFSEIDGVHLDYLMAIAQSPELSVGMLATGRLERADGEEPASKAKESA